MCGGSCEIRTWVIACWRVHTQVTLVPPVGVPQVNCNEDATDAALRPEQNQAREEELCLPGSRHPISSIPPLILP